MSKELEAAGRLEELLGDMKQAVIDIREHSHNRAWCYWRLYTLRKELGRIVATLGAGTPITPRR
jgi:hypothetical protein